MKIHSQPKNNMNYIIQEILKNNKITDYLSSKGINPANYSSNGRIRYKCPIHAGDNTPSFIVYTNDEYENYYCYGCKSRYNIIHLYSELEKVSIKKTIENLSNGIVVDLDSELEHILREINEDNSIQKQFTPVEYDLILSRQIYNFIKSVDKDENYKIITEKVLKKIDQDIEKCDLEALKDTYDYLEDKLFVLSQEYKDKNS